MNETPSIIQDQQALQRFVVANADLEVLEVLAKRFNIFEVLGVVRTERIHTNFLGFLLNPRENHGLRDHFLKRFLQIALENRPSVTSLTPMDIGRSDLLEAKVYIERDYNDVLIRDVKNDISVIVENKVNSAQHSNQLERYYGLEFERYPKRGVFGIYLTIEGDDPEHEHYAQFSHSQIKPLIMDLSKDTDLNIDPGVQFALKQYTDLLGRHFMADEQIKTLCEKLYRQHKQAIDLIVRHMPNPKAVVRDRLRELVEADDALILDDCTKSLVRFIPKSLDLPYFRCGAGWTRSKRILLFEFVVKDSVHFFLEMGPGDKDRRGRIRDFALANKTFQVGTEAYGGWQPLSRKEIIESLDDLDPVELVQTIESKWQDFLRNELPRIEQAFLSHEWPPA